MALLLITTACTQPAAEVTYNGQNRYGRDGSMAAVSSRSYSNASSYSSKPSRAVSQTTYQAASVSSIGVSDLSAPTSSTAPTPSTVASSDLAPPTANGSSAPVATAPVSSTSVSSASAPAGSPFAVGNSNYVSGSKSVESKPVASAPNSSPVNLWTKEPHFGDESKNETAKTAAEMKPAAGKAPAASTLSAQAAKPASVANYMWPVSSKKVVSSFGPKGGGRVSGGIDIASAEGEPVWAASDGEIVFVGDELKGYGNMVLIKHEDGKTTTYAHLSRASVDKYDRVKQGDIIGYVGSTGNVRDPQLFFAINEGKTALDPQKYLSRNVAGL